MAEGENAPSPKNGLLTKNWTIHNEKILLRQKSGKEDFLDEVVPI
jgi:hypothetical protein